MQLEGGDTSLTSENQDPDASQEKKAKPDNDNTLLPGRSGSVSRNQLHVLRQTSSVQPLEEITRDGSIRVNLNDVEIPLHI